MHKIGDQLIHAVDHCGSQLKDHHLGSSEVATGRRPLRGQGEPAATRPNDQGRPLP